MGSLCNVSKTPNSFFTSVNSEYMDKQVHLSASAPGYNIPTVTQILLLATEAGCVTSKQGGTMSVTTETSIQ